MTAAARRKPAPTQPELPKMPAKTKIVLRAEEYCASLDEVEAKKENAKHRMLALVGEMKASAAVMVICVDSVGERRKFVLETLEKLKATKSGGR